METDCVQYMTDAIALPAQSMVALAVLAGNEKDKGGNERVKSECCLF